MTRKETTEKLRRILGGDFQSFKYSGLGNWYNQPKESDYPLRLFDKEGYYDVENESHLLSLEGYSQSKDSFHINKGGISNLEDYNPLPLDSEEVIQILNSQNKKDG